MIYIKKEIRYIRQKAGTNDQLLEKQKDLYKRQGYLVVTILEGTGNINMGIKEIIKNHIT